MHEQINSHNKLRWDFHSKALTTRKESFLNLYFESLGKENFDFSFLLLNFWKQTFFLAILPEKCRKRDIFEFF